MLYLLHRPCTAQSSRFPLLFFLFTPSTSFVSLSDWTYSESGVLMYLVKTFRSLSLSLFLHQSVEESYFPWELSIREGEDTLQTTDYRLKTYKWSVCFTILRINMRRRGRKILHIFFISLPNYLFLSCLLFTLYYSTLSFLPNTKYTHIYTNKCKTRTSKILYVQLTIKSGQYFCLFLSLSSRPPRNLIPLS